MEPRDYDSREAFERPVGVARRLLFLDNIIETRIRACIRLRASCLHAYVRACVRTYTC